MHCSKLPVLIFSFIQLIHFFSLPLMSNGGPVEGSSLASTGNVQLKKIENINLVYEKLSIKPMGEYVAVSIIYELNCLDDNRTVAFGFPFFNDILSDYWVSFKDESYPETFFIEYFYISVNGLPVAFKEEINDVMISDDKKGEIKWYLSKLPLKKGSNTIEVYYCAKSYFDEPDIEGTNNPPKIFTYNFKPAAGWGNGIVGKLEVFVMMDKSLIEDHPDFFKISGLKGIWDNTKIYHVTVKNADFSKINNLEIYCRGNLPSPYIRADKELNSENTSKRITRITTLDDSDGTGSVQNLIDGKSTTAWIGSTSKQGINEWIDVEFKKGSSIRFIKIANGFWKSQDVYRDNSRIKTLECDITLRRKDGSNMMSSIKRLIKLDDRYETRPPGWDNYFYGKLDGSMFETVISPFYLGFDYEITKIRFTIKEIYPGIKAEGACITELLAY